jgi:F-type H+-transporting ATPase subunit gamma
MPANMRDIKRRIRSVTSIEHITSAMKLVSTSKFRRAKTTFENTTAFFNFVTEAISEIMKSGEEIPEEYIYDESDKNNAVFIVITGNRGLAGGFNTAVIKKAEEEMQKREAECFVVAIGNKGKEHFTRKGKEIIGEYLRPPENITFLEVDDIIEDVLDMYREGKINEIVLVYTEYLVNMNQAPKAKRLLPFEITQEPTEELIPQMTEYEPSIKEVFNYLIPKYIEMVVYEAIVESATCEHAARRVAMENATDNAQTMISDLNLFYNRARQAAITSEITEIVSGADAL